MKWQLESHLGSKKKQKHYGRVDYGQSLDNDTVNEANQASFIEVYKWYVENTNRVFLITSLTGEQKGLIVQTALQLCEGAGVKVVNMR